MGATTTSLPLPSCAPWSAPPTGTSVRVDWLDAYQGQPLHGIDTASASLPKGRIFSSLRMQRTSSMCTHAGGLGLSVKTIL